MAHRILRIALLGALLLVPALSAFGQEGDRPPLEIVTPKKGEATPGGDDTTGPKETSSGDGTTTTGGGEAGFDPPEETLSRGTRASSGVGGGAIFWFTESEAPPISGGLMFEGRGLIPLGNNIISLEWIGRIEFHDWRTMLDIWCWYGQGSDDEIAGKISFLWPGIFLAPLLGANYTGGFGLAVYPAPQFFIDFGIQSSLYMRISDCDFVIDLGIGAYAGLGVKISEDFGMTLRGVYGAPFFNSTVDQVDQHIVSTSLMFNWLL